MDNHLFNYNHKNKKFMCVCICVYIYIYIYNELIDVIQKLSNFLSLFT